MAKQTNIRRRGKAWVVSARVNGTQQWKSCRTRDEAELELALVRSLGGLRAPALARQGRRGGSTPP